MFDIITFFFKANVSALDLLIFECLLMVFSYFENWNTAKSKHQKYFFVHKKCTVYLTIISFTKKDLKVRLFFFKDYNFKYIKLLVHVNVKVA